MKPKTKLQKRVDALFRELPTISDKQKAYAIDKLFDKNCLITKAKCWCSICGGIFDDQGYKKGSEVVCPHCGSKIVALRTTKRNVKDNGWYTVPTVKDGMQVFRNFVVEKYMNREEGYYEPRYFFFEAVQQWIDEKGKVAYVARPRNICCNRESFIFRKPMEIREARGYYNPYDICSKIVYPGKIMPALKKRGFTTKLDFNMHNLAIRLLTNNEAEMLIKTKQYDLLRHYHMHGYSNVPMLWAVRICNRNNYIVKDASMWGDYLRLLEYFHLDTHNAHYVCPANLKEAHDKLMLKKQKIEAETRRKDKLKQVSDYEPKYKKDKSKFFGLCFGDSDIRISVLNSVFEFAEEGEAMHHCVFTNNYFKKKNSLILSAKDIAGNRLETIEVSLKTFKVLQCRGKYNNNSSHHDHILELMKIHMNEIIKRAS